MREYEFIPSLDADHSCWEMIGWFTNAQYVARQLEQRHGSELICKEEKSQEIAAYVQQATGYFGAARLASLATRPTLLYYCMVQLASAMSIASSPSLTQRELRPDHGLSFPTEETRKKDNVELRRLKTHQKDEGTWQELLRAVPADHHALPGAHKQVVSIRRQAAETPLQLGTTLRLAWLLEAFPSIVDLAKERFPNWCVDHSIPVGVSFNRTSDPNRWLTTVEFSTAPPRGVRDLVELHHRQHDKGLGRKSMVFNQTSGGALDALPVSWLLWEDGQWFAHRHPDRLLPRLPAFFGALFIFGSLARYCPRQWSSLIDGRDSMAVQVIERFMHLAVRQIPILSLRELRGRHTHFGASWGALKF